MAWDWKSKIREFFGVSARPQTAAAGLSPEATHGMQQLANGTHRSYNRAELQDITEVLRDLKDATRHNLVVLHNLMNAQPQSDDPTTKALLQTVKKGLRGSYESCEYTMVELNANANMLEQISAKAGAVHNSAQDHLPVYDAQRNMVVSMAHQLRCIYTVHKGLTQAVTDLQPHFIWPQPANVAQALAINNEKLPVLIHKLTRLTFETLGRQSQSVLTM